MMRVYFFYFFFLLGFPFYKEPSLDLANLDLNSHKSLFSVPLFFFTVLTFELLLADSSVLMQFFLSILCLFSKSIIFLYASDLLCN